jgi:hypothetical protein
VAAGGASTPPPPKPPTAPPPASEPDDGDGAEGSEVSAGDRAAGKRPDPENAVVPPPAGPPAVRELYRVSPIDRGTSELDHGLDPDHFPSVAANGEELTGAAHFGNDSRVNDFASSHTGTHGQGFKVIVPQKWLEDNDIEVWQGRTPEQLEFLIPRELIPEFNRFPREPWSPGKAAS